MTLSFSPRKMTYNDWYQAHNDEDYYIIDSSSNNVLDMPTFISITNKNIYPKIVGNCWAPLLSAPGTRQYSISGVTAIRCDDPAFKESIININGAICCICRKSCYRPMRRITYADIELKESQID